MSSRDEMLAQMDLVGQAISGAITCLATAGTLVIGTRHEGGTADALITALRDDLSNAIDDAKAIRSVLKDERVTT